MEIYNWVNEQKAALEFLDKIKDLDKYFKDDYTDIGEAMDKIENDYNSKYQEKYDYDELFNVINIDEFRNYLETRYAGEISIFTREIIYAHIIK